MKKALVIVPHLSTGGSCQFTLNKIKMLVELGIGIYVIEYSFLSPDFVVQRNQIKEIIEKQHIGTFFSYDTGEGYPTFKGRVDKSITYETDIELIQPDFIFLEENPKMFMDENLINFIYNYDAKVFETTHDSSFQISTHTNSFKTFVSPYSALQYLEAGGDLKNYTIIEDPIDTLNDLRHVGLEELKEKLNFDTSKKHVVIVGLFTPRKNQAYAIEIAKHLIKFPIVFHFIGNMADNFREYWQPLVDNLPANCILYGEKDNVDDYIRAADLFLFTSEGSLHDKELNPLVIREAITYPTLPKLIFNLGVYLKRYDAIENMHFLKGHAPKDAITIYELLNIQSMYNNPHIPQSITYDADVLIVIGAYPNNPNREKLTLECIEKVKPLRYDIAIASHHPISKEIEAQVNVVLYDRYNPITTHSYYKKFWSETADYYAEINLDNKPLNQSLCVLNNIKNGLAYAHANKYKAVMYINYDILVDEKDYITIMVQTARLKCPADDTNHADIVACVRDTDAGKGYETTCIFLKPSLIKLMQEIPKDPEGYNEFAKKIGAENYLEHFFYAYFKRFFDAKSIKITELVREANTILEHTGLGTQSCSEYVALLPIEGDDKNVCLYSFSYNNDKRVKIFRKYHKDYDPEKEYPKVIMQHNLSEQNACYAILSIEDFTNPDIQGYIECDEIFANNDYVANNRIMLTPYIIEQLKTNGIFRFKKKEESTQPEQILLVPQTIYDATPAEINTQKKPRIRLVHLFVNSRELDEQIRRVQSQSRNVLSKVSEHGWHYVPVYNDLYTSIPPIHSCKRPNDVVPFGAQRNEKSLTSYHYGCYEAFKTAVLGYTDSDIDLLIVCEGDCKLEVPLEEFISFVENNIKVLNEKNVAIVSYGDKNALETGVLQSIELNPINENIYQCTKIIGLQCIGFLPQKKHEFINMFTRYYWDAMDILINDFFNPFANNLGTLAIVEKRLTTQYDGFSLIEQRVKKFL